MVPLANHIIFISNSPIKIRIWKKKSISDCFISIFCMMGRIIWYMTFINEQHFSHQQFLIEQRLALQDRVFVINHFWKFPPENFNEIEISVVFWIYVGIFNWEKCSNFNMHQRTDCWSIDCYHPRPFKWRVTSLS